MPRCLSERTRYEVLLLHENNYSTSKISTKLKIRRGSIYDIIKKFRFTGEVLDLKSSGRPRKTTRQQDHHLVLKAISNRQSSTKQLQRISTISSMNISRETVHRRLKEAGISFPRHEEKSDLDTAT